MRGIIGFMASHVSTVYTKRFILMVFGIIISIVLLEMLLRVWGGLRIAFVQRSMPRDNSFVILTLGESTTSSEYPDSWPSQLGILLRAKYPGLVVQVVNKAKTGIQTSEAVGNIDEYISVYRPDLIISMIGINDGMRDALDTSVFAPVTEKTRLKIVKLFRLFHRYTRISIRRYTDFIFSGSPDKLNEMAGKFRRNGAYHEAEIYLKKSLEHNNRRSDTHLQLSYLYRETGRIAETKQSLLKAVALDAVNDNVYRELGVFYRDIIHNQQAATDYFVKALEINDRNGETYMDYGMNIIYDEERLAATFFDKAIAYRPDLDWAYFYRAELYLRDGNKKEAENLYNDVLERDPNNTVAQMRLAQLFVDNSRGEVAGLSDSKEESNGSVFTLAPSVKRSYARLIEAASGANIPVVAMQYPLQPVEPLQEVIDEVKVPGSRVAVVGNMDNFREVFRTHPYDALFVDAFGGNFGHATREGNALIAENVVGAIDSLVAASVKE